MLPKYPIYVPTKNRADTGYTMKFLQKDAVPFTLVLEPAQVDRYRAAFPEAPILVLPGDDLGLIYARNWIKAHATAAGAVRHWQLDDNITHLDRRYKAHRIRVHSGTALRIMEDFVDRYTNVAIAGPGYEMFFPDDLAYPPFVRNVHVYSASLILNEIPYTWRSFYNDDTDICLQALASGYWCTVQFGAILAKKMATMRVKGGNTDSGGPVTYQGDGRLQMARSLERLWPYVVSTRRRWGRPQHVIRGSWRGFDQPLIRRDDIAWDQLPAVDNYGMELQVRKPIKSATVARYLAETNAAHRAVLDQEVES